MAFLWRRKSFWFKFVIIVAIFWITIVLIHFSGKKELELTKTDLNDRFSEFLIDSRRDVNHIQDLNLEQDYKNVEENDFKQIHNKKSEIIKVDVTSHKQPGDMGHPVILPTNLSAEIKKIVDEGWTKNAFNEYVSNMISVRRELPDPRYIKL